MRRVAEAGPEPDADHAVDTFGGQADAELRHQVALVHGRYLCAGALAVDGDARMGPDRQRVDAGHGTRAGNTVEMRVGHGDDGCVGVLTQAGQGALHLLHRLAGVDGDDAARPLHKGLVIFIR